MGCTFDVGFHIPKTIKDLATVWTVKFCNFACVMLISKMNFQSHFCCKFCFTLVALVLGVSPSYVHIQASEFQLDVSFSGQCFLSMTATIYTADEMVESSPVKTLHMCLLV